MHGKSSGVPAVSTATCVGVQLQRCRKHGPMALGARKTLRRRPARFANRGLAGASPVGKTMKFR